MSLLFATLNIYLTRYVLYIIPVIILLGVYGITIFITKFFGEKWALICTGILVIAVISLAYHDMSPKKFNDTAAMSYKRTIKVEKDCIAWLEKQPWRDSFIRASFPVYQGIIDKRNGYLSGKIFNATEKWDVPTKYFVLFYLDDNTIATGGKIIKRFDNYYAHIVVYEF